MVTERKINLKRLSLDIHIYAALFGAYRIDAPFFLSRYVSTDLPFEIRCIQLLSPTFGYLEVETVITLRLDPTLGMGEGCLSRTPA
jgi:hypothetical protein